MYWNSTFCNHKEFILLKQTTFFSLQTCISLTTPHKQFLAFSVPEHDNHFSKTHMCYTFCPVLHVIFKPAYLLWEIGQSYAQCCVAVQVLVFAVSRKTIL